MRRNNIWPSSATPSVPVRSTTILRTMWPRRNRGFPRLISGRGTGPTHQVGALGVRQRRTARQHAVHRITVSRSRPDHLVDLGEHVVVDVELAVHIDRIRPP